MSVFDVFNQDPFTMTSLTDSIDRKPFKPQGLAKLNVFTPRHIRTETISIEERDGFLSLIETSMRGEPLSTRKTEKRRMKQYATTRIGKKDRILASELDFVRQMGSQDATMELQREIARRMGGSKAQMGVGLLDEIDLTLEHMRLGAIQGKFIDHDGTVLEDWNLEFDLKDKNGQSMIQADVQFNFSTMGEGDFKQKLINIRRRTIKNARGSWMANTRLQCYVGDEAWDEMHKLAEIRQLFRNTPLNALNNPDSGEFDTFTYAGVTFTNYRGSDELLNGDVGIGLKDMLFFPSNMPNLFLEVFAHGEQFRHLGTTGKKVYAQIIRDLQRDEFVDLEVKSYPLYVCTNASVIVKGVMP